MATFQRAQLKTQLYGWRPEAEAERSFANLLFMAGLPDQAAYGDREAATLGLLAVDLGAADFWLAEAQGPGAAFDMTAEGLAAHRALAAQVGAAG